MSYLEFFHEVIKDLKNKKAVFILCDGYDAWSYGYPINPICFDFDEYKFIVFFFQTVFNHDLEDDIINHSGWDCVLPDQITAFIGKRVCTFTKFPSFIKAKADIPTEDDWEKYLYKTEEEKQKSIEAKKLFFSKIKNLNK